MPSQIWAILLFRDWREQLGRGSVQQMTMMASRLEGPRARKATRRKDAALLLAAALLGLLGLGLMGCGRQAEPPAPVPAPAPRRAAENRAPALADRPTQPPTPLAGERPAPPPPAAGEDTSTKEPQARTPAAAPINHIQDRRLDAKLAFYELRMDPADLVKLDRSPYGNETYPATFIADGEVYPGVKVRCRGDWARSWPKKCLKVFFNQDKLFEGQNRLNLNSGWHDPAFIREPLAYYVYAVCGVPAPRSRMVRLRLNDQPVGLYVEVEQPGKAFLRRVHLEGASLFKAVSRENQADERDLGREAAFRGHYARETRKTEDLRDLQEFCHELQAAPDALDFFTRRVDVERYINYLAATVLVQNWDCYNKNHYLAYDGRGSRKWMAVPWDLDRTFGDHWNWTFDRADMPILLGTRQLPGITGWNRMASRFLAHPVLRSRFLDRLQELLDQEFTTEKLFPIVDRLDSAVASHAAQDRRHWPSRANDFRAAIAQLKRFIENRRTYLKRAIPALRRGVPAGRPAEP